MFCPPFHLELHLAEAEMGQLQRAQDPLPLAAVGLGQSRRTPGGKEGGAGSPPLLVDTACPPTGSSGLQDALSRSPQLKGGSPCWGSAPWVGGSGGCLAWGRYERAGLLSGVAAELFSGLLGSSLPPRMAHPAKGKSVWWMPGCCPSCFWIGGGLCAVGRFSWAGRASAWGPPLLSRPASSPPPQVSVPSTIVGMCWRP